MPSWRSRSRASRATEIEGRDTSGIFVQIASRRFRSHERQLSRLAVLRGTAPRARARARRLGGCQRCRTTHDTRRRRRLPHAGRASSAPPAGCATRSAAPPMAALPTRSTRARSASSARRWRAIHGLADFAFAMQGLGSGAITPRTARAEQKDALSAARRARRGDRGVRAVRAGRRLGRRRACSCAARDDGDALRARRREDLDLQRRHRRFLRRVRPHRRGAEAARGISAFIVDAGTPGFAIAERIDVIAPHPLGAAAASRTAACRNRSCSAPPARASRSRCARSTSSARPSRRRRSASRGARSTRRSSARPRAACSADARRFPAHAGEARADGDGDRCCRAAHLPRRLAARPGQDRHARGGDGQD